MPAHDQVDVAAWLRDLKLERYLQVFRDAEIDADILPELTEADLKELGVPLGPRRKLMNAIAVLAQRVRTPGAERRQLTVMFCDLVDSTALAARLDPEDLRTVLQAYQQCCARIIRRFEGHVATFMGDGALVYFGYPRAHEDDAVRAVRAGLELVAAVESLRPLGEVTIRSRIGVATGPVVVGDWVDGPGADRDAVVGETPNLAARLQDLAGTGHVVVSPGTKYLLGEQFEYADFGEHQLKGFGAPVKAWRVIGECSPKTLAASRALAARAPMVGRDEETARLIACWESACTGGPQVVLLSGEPGIGKSRMIARLLDKAAERPHVHIRYYGSPYHQQSAMHVILDQLERAAGYARDDPPAIKLDKLEVLFALGSTEPEAAAAAFAPLLAIPTDGRYPQPSAELSRDQQKDAAYELLWQQLIGISRKTPILMIVEDAHWIDAASIAMFEKTAERLLDSDLPMMLLMAHRPGLEPAFAADPRVSSITLGRLERDGIETIVLRLTDGKPLPDGLIDQIVAKTDGVPLFVEELTKTVLESDLVSREGDRYVLTGSPQSLTIPVTLQDSLMARLDRLNPGKQVAQVGAAIGREFYHQLLVEALASLEEKDVETALDRLMDAELIQRRGAAPNVTYRFKHALIQDTAYNSLLKARRQDLHRQIGDLLETKFPHTADAEPELLAHHYQEASLPTKAIPYALKAGEAATTRYAPVEARGRFESALAMAEAIPATEEASRFQIQAAIKLAEVAQNRQHFEADLERLSAARGLARELGDDRQLCRIHYWIGRMNYVLGKFDAGVASAEEALHVAELLGGADEDTAGPVNLLARLNCLRGEARLASDFATRSLAQMSALGNRIEEAGVAGVLGFALGMQGRFDEAILAADRGVALASELEHLPTLAAALQFRGVAHGWAGRLETAVPDFDRAVELCEQANDLFRSYLVHGWRGEAYLIAGEVEKAEADLRKCLSLGEGIGTSFHRAAFEGLLAGIKLMQKDVEGALRLSSEAISAAYESAQAWGRSIALRVNAAVLLETDPPDLDKAEQAVESAIAIQERRECRCDLAWTQLVSAEVQMAKGAARKADAALAKATRMFEQMGIAPGRKMAEAVAARIRTAG